MSSDPPAIAVKGLSKTYRISHNRSHDGFRDLVVERLKHPLRRGDVETFTALRDVSFDVGVGEVLGVIGPNGAGKSTLLKVLARITEPDRGTAVLQGRLGSLLEVGTGFHPELTGRENVFLNGAILGMTRREIAASFDEIVDFAGVERFLDTPVKRYSSGMYVRLAFSVAAHLRAEILVIDEVLAVGDMAFQQKCLDKMSDVAQRQGRTILFISHNMAAVQALCDRSLVIDQGTVVFDGEAGEAVNRYLALGREAEAAHLPGTWSFRDRVNELAEGNPVIEELRLRSSKGEPVDVIQAGDPLVLELVTKGLRVGTAYDHVAVQVVSELGVPLFGNNTAMTPAAAPMGRAEREVVRLELPGVPLTPGRYWLTLAVVDGHGGPARDALIRAASFTVVAGDAFGTGYELASKDGLLFVRGDWSVAPSTTDQASSPSRSTWGPA